MHTANATFLSSAAQVQDCPEDDLPEFAFAGRSNVGKSSLLNLLVGHRDLARVSPTPGHTKHLNFYTVNGTWRLVDLPGYGYARAGWKERQRFGNLVAEYLAQRRNLRCAFALVDASIPPQDSDLEFLQWLADEEVPCAIVFTKVDKAGPVKTQENVAAFRTRLAEWCAEPPPMFECSALKHEGRGALLGLIDSLLEPERKRPQAPAAKPRPRRNTPW